MKRHIAVGLMVALIVGLPSSMIAASGADRVPASHVAWQWVGRVLLNPATGAAQVLGYFTFLEGIPGPMFSGAPGESTAFFTLRSEPFTLQNFPNGDVLIGLNGTGTVSLYLDTTPDQDFSNPSSFSDGKRRATFHRRPGQPVFVGPVALDTFSMNLLFSQPFFWQGQSFNIRKLIPNGVTVTLTASTAFLPSGVDDFPVFIAFGASAVAIAGADTKDD